MLLRRPGTPCLDKFLETNGATAVHFTQHCAWEKTQKKNQGKYHASAVSFLFFPVSFFGFRALLWSSQLRNNDDNKHNPFGYRGARTCESDLNNNKDVETGMKRPKHGPCQGLLKDIKTWELGERMDCLTLAVRKGGPLFNYALRAELGRLTQEKKIMRLAIIK